MQGRIFIEPTLPELSPPDRHAAYVQLATTLAALHTVRPQEVGLQKYGRPAGYCARQASCSFFLLCILLYTHGGLLPTALCTDSSMNVHV